MEHFLLRRIRYHESNNADRLRQGEEDQGTSAGERGESLRDGQRPDQLQWLHDFIIRERIAAH